jgi:hypothetical protein
MSEFSMNGLSADKKPDATRIWRVTGSLPPNEKSHGWRRNIMFLVEGTSLEDAVGRARLIEPEIDIHSVNHHGHLRKPT